jgi:2-C-methyl-D-erythritol 4-phosphate cytidylyltransferase / 2-C-methyl-D-erythritol 2,4-cyclodiphosphate synthase
LPDRTAVLVLAAGAGKRLAAGNRKAFTAYKGRTILEYCLARVRKWRLADVVCVVLHPQDVPAWGGVLKEKHRVDIVAKGGKERQYSVLNGLLALEKFGRIGKVLIHDSARPFVPQATVRAMIRKINKGTGVVPVLPEPNTLKQVKGDRVLRTLDRSDIVEVQTPQGFIFSDILRAYKKFFRRHVTDDAQVFESAGGKILTVPGSRSAFKITWPEDLRMFRMLAGN